MVNLGAGSKQTRERAGHYIADDAGKYPPRDLECSHIEIAPSAANLREPL